MGSIFHICPFKQPDQADAFEADSLEEAMQKAQGQFGDGPLTLIAAEFRATEKNDEE